jgi:hypothetical protein
MTIYDTITNKTNNSARYNFTLKSFLTSCYVFINPLGSSVIMMLQTNFNILIYMITDLTIADMLGPAQENSH